MLYRSDIQGLRAVALLLVLTAHWQIPYMSFGYIGVDIFFVISGYVITGALLDKNQSIISFYAARFRRLFPALFFLVCSVVVFSIVLFPPDTNEGNLIEANFAVLWVSNFHFAFSNQNYFEGSDLNLFLHTWSLGLEEQYYLIWPLILLGLHRLAQSRVVRPLSLIFFGALFLAIACVYLDAIKFYYLLPSRIWQFLAGAVAYFLFCQGGSKFNKSPDLVICILFIGALVSYLLMPLVVINTLGLLFLVCYVLSLSPSESILNKILSTPKLVAIGNRSYSLYLWHWPIWLILSSLAVFDGFWLYILVILLTCIFSEISFKYIEVPVRNSAYLKRRNRATIYLCFFCIVVFMAVTAQILVNNQQRVRTDFAEFQKYRHDMPIIYKHKCDDWYNSSSVKPCEYIFSNNTEQTVVLFGDSVGVQWFSAILYSMNTNTKLVVYTKSGCPILDVKKYYSRIRREYTECEIWRNAVIQDVQRYKPEVVFIGNSAEPFTQYQWETGLDSILGRLSPIAKNVAVLTPTPVLSMNPLECLIRKEWISQYFDFHRICSNIRVENKLPHVAEWIENATKNHRNAIALNFNDLVCDSKSCSINDGLVKYRDSLHLTNSYVEELKTVIKERLKEKINTTSFD